MRISQNISLKPYTSMHVGGLARYFIEVASVDELKEAMSFAKNSGLPHFILGGGSNILISDNGFNGVVIRIAISGIKLLMEADDFVEYEVGAGEAWDRFVELGVGKGLYGIENMSHIPGSVGASVVQNIGCYGQEVSEITQLVRAVDALSLESVVLQKNDLKFSYRRSRLNDSKMDRGRYVVTHIVFKLQKHGDLNMSYGDIQKYFSIHANISPSLRTIREAVISIRDSKFPFPDRPEHGTCGSFWNADSVDEPTYEKIIAKLKARGFSAKAQEMTDKKNVFAVAQGFKVPYGIFVEVLGFKGKSWGGAKVLETHAGVINNFTGEATAQDIHGLSQHIIDAVYREFGIKMKVEPELVGDFTTTLGNN